MNESNSTNHFGSDFGAGLGEVYDTRHNISIKLFKAYSWYNFITDAVFVVPTIFGNVLIIAALGFFPALRKSVSCILIGNLAISDLLVGMFVFPLDMLILTRREVFDYVDLCLLFFSLMYTAVGASVLNLFLLSLERFHAIMCPLKHRLVFTKGRTYITIVIVWLVTFSVGFLPVFGLHNSVDEENFICGGADLLSDTYTRIICSIAVLTLLVNSIFFFIIARVAMRTAKAFTELSISEEEREKSKKNIRHTKMMLIVSGLFIMFWGPFCILSLVPKPSPTLRFVKSWCACFGLINSALNWIVYGVRSKKFRLAFKALLTCNCSRGKVEISSVSV